MQTIRTREVLQAVLLQTLADSIDGLPIHAAYESVERRYSLPQEWYREIPASSGYEELEKKGLDWRSIPQDKLVELVPTEPQWQNELRWARNELRKAGLLDTSAPRGVWRLSPGGFGAAADSLLTLSSEEKRIATPKTLTATSTNAASRDQGAGTTLRQALQANLSTLTSSMPLADLQLLVDIARSIRKRGVHADV